MKILTDGLQDLRQGYMEGREGYGCNFECGSANLGALMKALHCSKFLNGTSPDAPFEDLSIVVVVERLRAMKVPIWTSVPDQCCYYTGYHNDYYRRNQNPCLTAHKCPETASLRKTEEVILGVGEFPKNFSSEGILSHQAARIVGELRDKVSLDLEELSFGKGK